MDVYIIYIKNDIPQNEMIHFLADYLNIDKKDIGLINNDQQSNDLVTIAKNEYEYGYRCTFEVYMSLKIMNRLDLVSELEFGMAVSEKFETNVLVSNDSPGYSWILVDPKGNQKTVYETDRSLRDDWEGGLEVNENLPSNLGL